MLIGAFATESKNAEQLRATLGGRPRRSHRRSIEETGLSYIDQISPAVIMSSFFSLRAASVFGGGSRAPK